MSRLPQIQKRALSIWVLIFLMPGFLFACADKTAGQNSTTGKSLTLIGAEEYLPWLTAALLIAFLVIFILIILNRTLQRRVAQRTHELRQAQSDLQKSKRWYREVFDAPTEAIFIQSVSSGRILHVNKAMLQMFGYESEEEVISGGMIRFADDDPPYSRADAIEKEELAIEGGPQVFEWLARKKTGERFWTEVSLHDFDIEGEKQVLAVVRDISMRKQMEESLRESEERYRRLVSNALDIIFRYEIYPEMKLTYINPAVESITGYTPEECYADPWLMLNMIHPDDANLMSSYIQSLAPPDESLFARWIGKDGVTRWMESRIAPVRSADGRLIAIEGITRDITARKQAEASLIESEAQYRRLEENISDVVWTADLAFNITYVSPSIQKLTGDTPEEYLVRRLEERHPPSSISVFKQVFEEELYKDSQPGVDKNRTRILEVEHYTASGGAIWAAIHLSFIRDAQGTITGIMGITRNVTERRQTEQLLRERERQYRILVEQIPVIVYVDEVSDGLRTLYVSPQIEKILGYTPQEWLERFSDLWSANTHPDDREAIHAMYLRCAKTGEPFEADYRIRSKDGRLLWIHDEAMMLRDEDGNPQLIHGLMQDITAQKQVESQIRQRIMELETLYESGLAISQILEPAEIARKVIELLEQKLSWHHTTVRLYSPQDESLELLAFNQPGLESEAERREVGQRFRTLVASSAQGMSGWAVRSKRVIHSNNLQHEPHYVDTYPGLNSGLYVPMMLGDRAIGVISIESEQPDAFSAADERLAATLATQAASALENARLFKAEQKQRQVSDALRDALSAGASMSASLDFETILDRLLEALERIVPFEGGSIMLVQQETNTTRVARMRGYKMLDRQALDGVLSHKFDIFQVENLRWMLEHKQPFVISDVRKYPGWTRVDETRFIRSWAGAPIIVNGRVIAFFSLDSAQTDFFTEDHAQLIKAFTGQASLALQNARLFEETGQRFREFAALYETSVTLSRETNLPDLMQSIVETAQKLLNSASSGIYLYDAEREDLLLEVGTANHIKVGVRLQLGEGAGGTVAQTRQPLRVEDYSIWERRSPHYEGTRIRAVLEVPMLYSGELIGVLAADEINDSERKFTEADERLLSLFASQAAGAIHSARLRDKTEYRLGQLQALHTIDRAISSSFELRPILNTVVNQTVLQLDVDAVDVLLYHPHLQMLEYIIGQGFRTRAIEQTRLQLGECFAGRAAYERRTQHVTNLPEAGSRFTRGSALRAEDFLEYYAVPLIAKGQVKGVMEVFHRAQLSATPEWIEFLETLAGQAAITIDQTQLFEDLQRANLELVIAYDATIEGWARAMDLRDRETESHTERVTELTISLARMFHIKDSDIIHLRRGALLHDIGKIGVPDHILLKKSSLTAREWEIMRRHPQFAYEMLQPIRYLRQSLDIPYCHHEKWDGTGYPRGLKGEQIPLVARIFTVVDVWDAITSDRPYRKALSKEEALAYISAQSGRHFDPQVTDAFLKMMGE
jgi:PAS domain S-box-containing protein